MTCFCGKPFVTRSGEFHTDLGYHSPPGHDHDDNCVTRVYVCSEGHQTPVSIQRRCPTPDCPWVGKTSCFCHRGTDKIKEWPALAQAEGCP